MISYSFKQTFISIWKMYSFLKNLLCNRSVNRLLSLSLCLTLNSLIHPDPLHSLHCSRISVKAPKVWRSCCPNGNLKGSRLMRSLRWGKVRKSRWICSCCWWELLWWHTSTYSVTATGTVALEEDAQILKVIEAYCTSAKTRQTLNSSKIKSVCLS